MKIAKLNKLDTESTYLRLERMIESKVTPLSLYPKYSIFWPKKPFSGRCIPEGIMPLNQKFGYDHEIYLEKFWNKIGLGQVIVCSPDDKMQDCYKSSYTSKLRRWLRLDYVLSPVCLLSDHEDVCMIIDDQMRYSVICGEPKHIEELEAIWGGFESLQAGFASYVDRNELGFGDDDRRWAHKYLIPFCK